MAIVNHRHEIVVFPIHKNASSSIKRAMYWLETAARLHGRDRGAAGMRTRSIPAMYPIHAKRRNGKPTMTPTRRLPWCATRSSASSPPMPSGRRSKMPASGSTPEFLAARGLGPDPNLNEFVRNFCAYAQSSPPPPYLPQSSVIGPFFNRHVLRSRTSASWPTSSPGSPESPARCRTTRAETRGFPATARRGERGLPPRTLRRGLQDAGGNLLKAAGKGRPLATAAQLPSGREGEIRA